MERYLIFVTCKGHTGGNLEQYIQVVSSVHMCVMLPPSFRSFCLFEALRPGQHFLVILGRLPGFNQYKAVGMKCLAQGNDIAPRVRIEPAIKSPTLSQQSYRCSPFS